VSAILNLPLKNPVDLSLIPSDPCPYGIGIEDYALCPRYSALVIDNVTVGPSPAWLEYRLSAIGLNPINNVVDVTNWVMAELSQPMHAFDAEMLHGNTIYIRPASEGESVTLLDEQTYKLTPAALVIADVKGPIALAGVMGGLDSAIGRNTTRIVLESANFHAANIRRTAARLKLRTDASMRFEKSQDPMNTVRGLARSAALLRIVSPGCRIVGGLGDAFRPAPKKPPIELPLAWLRRKLGCDISSSEVRRILEALQFGVAGDETALQVTVPSWRATKDVSIKDDLVEEVGRMVGYGTITPKPPLLPSTPPPENASRKYQHAIREKMTQQGFDEIYSYSFLDEDIVRRFGMDPEEHVRVRNPISVEQALLRKTLAPGIWRAILENAKHFESFRLFEIGQEIHKREGGELPEEVPHLVAAIYQRGDDPAFLYELKRAAETLFPGAEVLPAAARMFEHPARTAEVLWRGEAIGRLFEFHPSFIETGRAGVLDINLESTERLQPERVKYRPIRRFPASQFDLSVIVKRRELVGDIRKQVAELAGPQLEVVEFVRQYEGAPLAEGMKSVSYRLTVAAPDRTLSSEEAGAIRQGIIDGMRARGYELRV
jgi:phenylalanyl-tRNA synthetase beta chain